MSGRDWKECDQCPNECFTEKECNTFEIWCPSCIEKIKQQARQESAQKTIDWIEGELTELKNPYPPDVFLSKEGKFGNLVYRNSIEDVKKILAAARKEMMK